VPTDTCLGNQLTVTDALAPGVTIPAGSSYVVEVRCQGPAIDLSQFGGFGVTDVVTLSYTADANGVLQPADGDLVRIWMLTGCTVTQIGGPAVEPVEYTCSVVVGTNLCNDPGPQTGSISFASFFVDQRIVVAVYNGGAPAVPIASPGLLPIDPPLVLSPRLTG
jgi:hypothetical protein